MQGVVIAQALRVFAVFHTLTVVARGCRQSVVFASLIRREVLIANVLMHLSDSWYLWRFTAGQREHADQAYNGSG
jgi:uncharacterized membrane protein